MNSPASDRIEAQEETFPGGAAALLRQRSRDLALQDGRAEARDADREAAFRELSVGDGEPAQEIPPGAENLVTWDETPDEAGHLTREIPAEDEADVSAGMAEEGRAEAEQDLRHAVNAETR